MLLIPSTYVLNLLAPRYLDPELKKVHRINITIYLIALEILYKNILSGDSINILNNAALKSLGDIEKYERYKLNNSSRIIYCICMHTW